MGLWVTTVPRDKNQSLRRLGVVVSRQNCGAMAGEWVRDGQVYVFAGTKAGGGGSGEIEAEDREIEQRRGDLSSIESSSATLSAGRVAARIMP